MLLSRVRADANHVVMRARVASVGHEEVASGAMLLSTKVREGRLVATGTPPL